MVKGTPSRQVAQTPWARSRSTLAGSGKYRPLAKALRLFVQLDETQSHWIPFDLYIIVFHSESSVLFGETGRRNKYMRKNSVKNRKINDEVRRVLAQIISGGIKDPRISPMTSVLAVEVAPDLKTCKAWVSVYGDEDKKKETMEGLKSASGFIRGELARRVNLRNTPQLQFILDDSIAYGVEMSRRIDDVLAADRRAEELRVDEPEEENFDSSEEDL